MKKIFTIIAALMCYHLCIGQNITETFNPKIGSSYFSYVYNATSHATGNAGINQVYDFSDIVLKPSAGKLVYAAASTNPDPDAFPSLNVWSADFADNYTYFKTSNNAYNVLGRDINFEGSNAAMVYSDYETIKLPVNYNDLQIDKIAGLASFTSSGLPVKLYRNGADSIKFDGYGTLKLDGKEKKVNRLKIVYNYTESVKYISDIKRENIVRKEEYFYIGVDEDFPTVVITTENKNAILQGNSTLSITNSIIINSKNILTSLENNNTYQQYFKAWQNESGNLEISAKSGDVISLYNLVGQKVFETVTNNDFMIINRTGFSAFSGEILVVKCINENASSVQKIFLK